MAKFTEEQLENLSDEEFLKLEEGDIEVVPESEDPEKHDENSEDTSQENSDDDTSDDSTEPDEDQEPEEETSDETEVEEEEDAASSDDSEQRELPEGDTGAEELSTEEDEEDGEEEQEEPEEKPKKKSKGITVPEGVDQNTVDTALDFHKKITAPFKADGKDFQVRSVEDAIRLMQQGVNYSRRMAELKPMKQLNRMLQDHKLNDPEKLNYLIDLSRGDKGAIEKLLKDNKIDTMDLDTEKETQYQANNYAGSAQDNEFRDALDNTMATPEGQALVREIHSSWDNLSKDRLKQDPSILGNLLQMKQTGMYEQIVNELDYQRGLGHLANVPFLQAFDQVGEAMAKAGVFGSVTPNEQPGLAPLQAKPAPVASGGRKVTARKKAQPNPHLSSTPPSQQQNTPDDGEPDWDNMSDEEFAKMAPPS